jgi:predicted ATPase
MLVRSLHVENLLAFNTFDLVLDGKTHVIVGPNGSGKSNIVRVFDLVGKAVGCHNSTPPATRDYVDRVEGGIDLYAITA